MKKKIVISLILLVFSAFAVAAWATKSVSHRQASNPRALRGLLQEMRNEWNGDTITFDQGGTITKDMITFDNGGTLDNATDTIFEWNENSDEWKWTFGTNTLTMGGDITKIDFATCIPTFTKYNVGAVQWIMPAAHGAAGTQLTDAGGDGTLSWAAAGATVPAGAGTEIQYRNAGAFGAVTGFIFETPGVEAQDEIAVGWGTSGNYTITYDADGSDQLLIVTNDDDADATTDPMIHILTDFNTADGTNMTADQQVFGVGKGTVASNVDLLTIDAEGDTIIAGDLTFGGTFYQAAIASAAAGVVNLNIDASLGGTIVLGADSTGKITTDNTVELLGAVDIGDVVASDTLSIMAKIDKDVYIDDDATDSPKLYFRDGTAENYWTIHKADGAAGDLHATADGASTDFSVRTGNLSVGDGASAGVAAMNGNDFFVAGQAEIDGTTQLDGAVTAGGGWVFAGGGSFDGDITVTDQIEATLATNGEEWLISATATDFTADVAISTITVAAQDNSVYALRLRATPNADAEIGFLIVEDNAGATDLLKVDAGGETTWTLDPGADVIISAVDHTAATGALDIDFDGNADGSEAVNIKVIYDVGAGAAESMAAVVIDLDDDGNQGTETLYGMQIAASDTDGTATIVGLDLANSLDDGIVSVVPAAGQAIVIDASSAVQTQADGVIDISHSSATTATSAINIAHTVGDLGAAEISTGILVTTADNTATNAALVRGIGITSADVTGHAGTVNQAIYTSGLDCALQADNGYIRVGTGSTPTITPADDCVYVEGTVEADLGFETGTSILRVATVDLSNAQLEALQGTPIELVAAPGVGELLEFVSALIIYDYDGDTLTETNDNLAIEYDDGAAAPVSETIEMTGFINQGSDQITRAIPVKDAMDAALDVVNKNLAILNTGDGDFVDGGADCDSTMTVIITYRVVSVLGL